MKEAYLRQIINEEIYNILNEIKEDEFESEELRHLKIELDRVEKRLANALKSNDNVEYNRASTQYNKAKKAIDSYINIQNKKRFRVNDIVKILNKNNVSRDVVNKYALSPTYVMDRVKPSIITLKRVDIVQFNSILDDLMEVGFSIKSVVEPTDKPYIGTIELNNTIQ